MAKLSLDGKYVTVERGDTLWDISRQHLYEPTAYKQLAAINNISNPNLIYVNQTIYLTKAAKEEAESDKPAKPPEPNQATVNQFGLQSNVANTLFATWTWERSNTESYKVLWTYDTGDGLWFTGSNSTINIDEDVPSLARQSTYSIPSGAKRVQFKVKPISKTYKKNNTDTKYWEAEWSTVKTYTDSTPLATPDVPSVKIEKYKLTAILDNIEVDATGIEFEVVKDNAANSYKTGKAKIVSSHASFSCTVDAGGEYKVRCRAYKGSDYSDWTAYSGNEGTIPATPSGITSIRASSETSVYLEWTAVKTATTYDVEYATNKDYFDGSDKTSSKTGIEFTHYDISGLESGQEYFFRVRAVNSDGTSSWSDIKSVVIGNKPAAPTTWSSTTTAITGESLTLHWVHNAEDGSTETYAELELIIDGTKETYLLSDEVISNSVITYTPLSKEDKEDGKTSSCSINTSTFIEGTEIEWRVRTAGITKELGDWSSTRLVSIYAPPTLELDITKADGSSIRTVESFPFYISGIPGPKTQAPIGYHVVVTSNEMYETTDHIGKPKTVNAGEQVYSKYFDAFASDESLTATALLIELSASNIDLKNNISYTVTCTVSMNSGLTVEESLDFTVAWTGTMYEPNAEIGIDEATLTAYIRPYCENNKQACYAVGYSDGVYTRGEEITDLVWGDVVRECRNVVLSYGKYIVGDISLNELVFGEAVPGLKTDTGEQVYHGIRIDDETEVYYCYIEPDVPAVTDSGEQVYRGTNSDGEDIYYCFMKVVTPVTDVLLSVYRREFDGSFVELARDLDGANHTTITDPHPALDYARYRIVAIDKETGLVSYYDTPGYPVGGKAAIIQWGEEWTWFEVSENQILEQPPWSGSMLKLPYNIDVSDSNKPDVALVEYIGREHPVGYYGTQLGQTSNWNMEIEKSDKDTLYALRRLSRWMGDVYVREPSGSGYWANITVSFNQKHCVLTVPVTLSITRVEGGV